MDEQVYWCVRDKDENRKEPDRWYWNIDTFKQTSAVSLEKYCAQFVSNVGTQRINHGLARCVKVRIQEVESE